jgi:hypothetical protein
LALLVSTVSSDRRNFPSEHLMRGQNEHGGAIDPAGVGAELETGLTKAG